MAHKYEANEAELVDSIFDVRGEFVTPQLERAWERVYDWEKAFGKFVPDDVARSLAVEAGVEEGMIPAFIAFIWAR